MSSESADKTKVSPASAAMRAEMPLQPLEPESDDFLHPLLPLVPEADRPEVGSVRPAGDYLRKSVVVG